MTRAQRRLPILSALLCLLLAAGPTAPAAAQDDSTTGVEVRLGELINDERASRGMARLRVDVRIVGPARSWSAEMARRGGISHHPDLRSQLPRGATAYGENVGTTNEASPAANLHRAFMSSPSHRRAILDPSYTDLGIGVAFSGSWTYVTQRFTAGAPASVSGAVPVMAERARAEFAGGAARRAVIVRDDVFPDALAAGPLAGGDGPILFTPPGPVLHPDVRRALERALPAGSPVFVIGGTAAVSGGVESEIAAAGWDVQRLDGGDRVATAARVARAVADERGRSSAVLIATAENWPDATAGSAFGARYGTPVLLAYRDQVPAATKQALRDLKAERVIALGGASALSDAVVREIGAERVAADDRQGTAATIARVLWGKWDAGAARRWTLAPDGGGTDAWAWSLGAAPYAALRDAPVLLAGERVSNSLGDYLRGLGYGDGRSAELLVQGPVPSGTVREISAIVEGG